MAAGAAREDGPRPRPDPGQAAAAAPELATSSCELAGMLWSVVCWEETAVLCCKLEVIWLECGVVELSSCRSAVDGDAMLSSASSGALDLADQEEASEVRPALL